MSGSGFKELKRVFVKDSVSSQSETDAIAAINKRKSGVKESVGESADTAPPTTEKSPDTTSTSPTESSNSPIASGITLTQDQLSVVVQNAIAQALKPGEEKIAALQSQLDGFNTKAEQDKAAVVDELNRTKQERDKLADVFKLMGNPNPRQKDSFPSFNRHHGLGREPDGMAKDFFDLLGDRNACPSAVWIDPNSGDRYLQKDTRIAQRFYRKNKDTLMESLETAFKRQGFLVGNIVTDAAQPGMTSGAAGSIPDSIMLETLSTMMRETHSPKYIYWQFPVTVTRLGNGPGANILVPRYEFLDEPTSIGDYELSTLTSYTQISNDNQALVMTTVPATVQEYGLGKGNKVATRAVAIPEFVSAYSLTDLMTALNTRLGHNYNGVEDLAIRGLYARTTRVYYNNRGRVAASPGDLSAGSGGILTENFLNNLYAQMQMDDIWTYPDGCYSGTLSPMQVAQLKNDLGEQWHPATPTEIQDLTNMLMAAGAPEMERVSQYLGKYCGFHLYQQNSHSKGAPGSEGVHSENIAGASHTTRSNYFFGPGAVGRGIGMPMSVRMDDAGTFKRLNRYVWLSFESYTLLDLDSAINPTQQTRCVEVRCLDQEV